MQLLYNILGSVQAQACGYSGCGGALDGFAQAGYGRQDLVVQVPLVVQLYSVIVTQTLGMG